MRHKVSFILSVLLFSTFANADSVSALERRVQAAGVIIDNIPQMDPINAIPDSLLAKAVCIATFPGVVRAGFIFGARYGKGVVSCRAPSGGWSAPSFMTIAGGSWGLQIGIASIDLVLIFLQDNAMDTLSKSDLTLGVGASVAAGPVGRNAALGTDYKLQSQIVSYSRQRGLFAGLVIEGAVLKIDHNSNKAIYGGGLSTFDILTTDGQTSPQEMNAYTRALERLP